LTGALKTYAELRRWWQGVSATLDRGVEVIKAREILRSQIAFCEVGAVLLQVALDHAAGDPRRKTADKARAALAEAREIEAKARAWLDFVNQPKEMPSEEQLRRGVAAYERGETIDLREAVQELRARLRAQRP
jgi:hypothetical protein